MSGSNKRDNDGRPLSKVNDNYGSTARACKDEEKSEAIAVHQSHSVMGMLFIIFGAFSFSIMFLLVKIMGSGANTFTLVLYRSLVQIAISLITLMKRRENPLGPPDCRFWLCVRGFFGSAAVCAWFFGKLSAHRIAAQKRKLAKRVNV